MTKEIATLPQAPRKKLVEKFADKYGVDGDKLMNTLKATCFKTKDRPPSNEEMMALLVVADQYGLNPFTREIFAFPDKQRNGIVPVVGVDGWSRIINGHKALDGIEFCYSDELTVPDGGKECPKWCDAIIYRKDRARPTVVREYLDEVYRAPFKPSMKGPWQTHTKRFLRHKALIQCARIAFGFSGIYDEDEAERIIDVTPVDVPPRPQLGDFEKKTPEEVKIFALFDEFGNRLGEFPNDEYVEACITHILAFTDLEPLENFWENNPGASNNVEIVPAYDEAKADLLRDQTPDPLKDDEWDAWTGNFISNCKTMPDVASINKLFADKKDDLEKIEKERPELYSEILVFHNLSEISGPVDKVEKS